MKLKSILMGFVTKKFAEYPILAGCLAGYMVTKSQAVMIAPDVFVRPSIAFLYLAAAVLPYPFVWVLPFISIIGSTHPLQVFVSVLVGSHVCFFLSRLLKWGGAKRSRVTAMSISTFIAQVTTAGFKSITGEMPFFTYLPLGMVKASTAVIAIVVIGLGSLWLLERFRVIIFGRVHEGFRPEESLTPRLQ